MLDIRAVDPQGADAMALLFEAWVDARALYPELLLDSMAPPSNAPLPDRGIYLVAYAVAVPVACGAVLPFESGVGEVKRMYVHREHRRRGYARAVLARLVAEARKLGYSRLVLETGNRQAPAMRFYEGEGFERTAPFGMHVNDPTSVCYAFPSQRQVACVRCLANLDRVAPRRLANACNVTPGESRCMKVLATAAPCG